MKIYRVEFDARSMSTGAGIVKFPAGFPLMPPDGTAVESWSAPKVEVDTGSSLDFMPSSIGARVCSARLVELLSEFANPEGYLQWLPLENMLGYKVLHFAKPLPVLDKDRSRFLSTGALLKPVFDSNLIKSLAIFALPGRHMFEFFIDERVKKETERRNIQGVYPKSV